MKTMPKGLLDPESQEDETESESEVLCAGCGRTLEADSQFCPKCGERRPTKNALASCADKLGGPKKCCCGCLACFGLFLIIFTVSMILYLNSWMRFGVETVGAALLGVDVTVDSVNVNAVQGRATLRELNVGSPTGFEGDIFNLGRFVFDVGPMSLFAAWLSDFVKPIEIEDLTVYDCFVNIETKGMAIMDSNAQEIVDHMNEVTEQISPELNHNLLHPDLPDANTAVNEGIRAMEAKVRVNKVRLDNITVGVTLEPLGPITYTLGGVEIKDVGKKGDGVYLYEFIEVLTRSLLMAVLKGAPSNIQSNLAGAFGKNLWKELDYAWVKFDNGQGMEELGEFAGWVSKQSALMPLKIAEQSASLTAKGMGMGQKIAGEALSIGSRLTQAALDVQNSATKTQTDASLESTSLSTKAAGAFAKMGLAFQNGMTKAMTKVD